MAVKGSTPVSDQTRASSLLDLAATGARLIPKQLKDEASLATSHLKSKSKTLIIGVGLAVVGLFFLFVMLVSLIVALIGGLASVEPIWFWSLMVAAGGLVLTAIFVLVGALIIKSAMPLMPQETIRGFKHDIGYLTQGNDFDPVEFDRLESEKAERKRVEKVREAELKKQAKKEDKAAIKRGEATTTIPQLQPTPEEIRQRAVLRRRHLGDIRSGLEEKTDVKAQFDAFVNQAFGKNDESADEDALDPTSPTAPYSGAARAGEKVGDANDYVKDNWQTLGVLGASSTALAVFAKKLKRKK